MERRIIFWFVILTFLLAGGVAFGHSTDHPQHENYTAAEHDWMKRQRNVAGQWCCGPENVTMLEDPHLRVRQGRYEVHVLGRWVQVPPSAMHRIVPEDPNPFPGEILLFFSTRGDTITIWCLTAPFGT
jgi:hypothetical protein